ncbi:hypothetical protein GF359_10710 [candidate division WOR-3 bacterium]|uniref:STAS/SEC14 domain-containing protein n=1 Tax=candidate division WOR-3 bacterium TaxID=2052148 RepID=A0A9D5KBH8_UNCW3|nr:hypothetical protein [candidate division WOR-3 bacterium]MBD3365672.1 hypothetical protein [candidate division WOR-3 bacterium]
MNYELRYDDEAGAVYLKVINMLTAKDVHEIMPASEEMFKDTDHYRVLIDATVEPKGLLEKEARKAFRDYSVTMKILEKIAAFGTNHVTRIMTKMAAAALGKLSAVRFFKSIEEARSWLIE